MRNECAGVGAGRCAAGHAMDGCRRPARARCCRGWHTSMLVALSVAVHVGHHVAHLVVDVVAGSAARNGPPAAIHPKYLNTVFKLVFQRPAVGSRQVGFPGFSWRSSLGSRRRTSRSRCRRVSSRSAMRWKRHGHSLGSGWSFTVPRRGPRLLHVTSVLSEDVDRFAGLVCRAMPRIPGTCSAPLSPVVRGAPAACFRAAMITCAFPAEAVQRCGTSSLRTMGSPSLSLSAATIG